MSGLKWAVGLEHEYNLRFEKLICSGKDELTHKILKKSDWNNTYLFVNIDDLLNIYNSYVIPILYNSIDNVRRLDNKVADQIEFNVLAYNFAKNKKQMPEDISNNINTLLKYSDWYRYFHYPKTFFNYRIRGHKIDITYLIFIDYLYSKIKNDKEAVYILGKSFSTKDINIARKLIYDDRFYKEWDKIIKSQIDNISSKYKIGSLWSYQTRINIDRVVNVSQTVDLYIVESKISKSVLKSINKEYFSSYISEEIEYVDTFNTTDIVIDSNEDLEAMLLMYNNEQPTIDYGYESHFIENKSIKYFKQSFIKAYEQLINQENVLLNVLSKLPELEPFVKKFGNIVQHHFGATENQVILHNIKEFELRKLQIEYCGSYHIWNTLFYNEKTTPDKFTNECITYGNCIQMLEPLFAAHFTTPSSNAMGNSLEHSRSSLRELLNIYSSYGTSDLSLLRGTTSTPICRLFMKPDNIFKHKSLDFYNYENICSKYDKVYDNRTNKIIKYNSALNDRHTTSRNYDMIVSDSFRRNYGNKKYKIENYIEKILKNSSIDLLKTYSSSEEGIGADFRTLFWEKNIVPPLKENWEQFYLLKGTKVYAYYVNIITNEIIDTPPYNEKKFKEYLKKSRIGLEFRVLDHMKTKDLIYPLSIVSLVSVHAYKNTRDIEAKNLIINKQIWHNEMVNVIKDGFSYKPSKRYLTLIEKEFKIKFKNYRNLNTETFFESFTEQLTKRYGNSVELKKIFPKKYIPEKFPSMNKIAWLEYLYDRVIKDKELRENIKLLYKIYREQGYINDNNVIETLGEEWIYDKDKVLVFIENNKILFN